MRALRLAGRVSLTLGLTGFCFAACGSSDGDLFGSGNAVDTNAGAGGEPDDGSGGAATGGRSTGGSTAAGGASTGGVQTGGAPAGGAAVGGKAAQLSCEALSKELAQELESIQSCKTDEECGRPLEGTSCGCTRDLVARKDADTNRFRELFAEHTDRCDGGAASTCDCPVADGFKCASHRCAWNYQNRSCEDVPPAELCLKRDVGASTATLKVGQTLAIEVQPKGCFSSSCTAAHVSTCAIRVEDDQFVVDAAFCLANTLTESGGCTGDCATDFGAKCQSQITLTEGQHSVRLGDMSLTFTVPGVIPEEALCVGNRF